MLSSIKDLLNTTTNLLPTSASGIVNASSTGWQENNFDAGAELLTHFQDDWEKLHKSSEINARRADELAHQVTDLSDQHVRQNQAAQSILHALQPLTSAPVDASSEIVTRLQQAVTILKQISTDVARVESSLRRLEDVIERNELEQRKRLHLTEYQLYTERRYSQLEELRGELATKYSQNIVQRDFREKLKLQERQQVFQEAFKTDLETYRALGTIPKILVESPTMKSSAMLEEIQLESDDAALEDFLRDSTDEINDK